ncbi:MAG: putative adenylyltransferase [Methanomassiliicoccales archaeon PtaU1.Bin030]|jgi:molybdopterin/thiamine biosynthesis adenylyltransferase|nr:MAG: putative adenylyltransferase [Methanomassiliicoccales archaeon PtaU1.Bin030]
MSRERYSRQIALPGFGEKAQDQLMDSAVGILGVGGLGSPAAYYLAAAGVGHLILADYQRPDVTNLNRQILHWVEDIDQRSKPASAAWKLKRFNPEIMIEVREEEVSSSNIGKVFEGVDVILDCLDSFAPRFILNEHSLSEGVPFVHAAVEGLHGQITVIEPGLTPCLRCLVPNLPPKKESFPILGAAAGVFGSLQAAEAVKLITGAGEPLLSKLLVGDLQYNSWETIAISRSRRCPACGRKK